MQKNKSCSINIMHITLESLYFKKELFYISVVHNSLEFSLKMYLHLLMWMSLHLIATKTLFYFLVLPGELHQSN